MGGPGSASLAVRQRSRDRLDRLRSPASPPARPARSPGRRPSTPGWPSISAPGAISRRRRSSPTATSPTGCPARCRSRHLAGRRLERRRCQRHRHRHDRARRAASRPRPSAPTGGAAATPRPPPTPPATGHCRCPSNFGATTITVTATSGDSTGYSQLSVTDLTLPGTTVLAATDPTGDDNGPGTYAYPTDSDFHPGAFDLTGPGGAERQHRVRPGQPGQSRPHVRVALRSPTARRVRARPGGDGHLDRTPRSRPVNYAIAPADAWSERIEAQGFTNVVWVDADGDSLGSAQLVVDATSKTATVVLPKAAFGTVGPGWVFTVTLTGQDGFSPDQARAFTRHPGAIQLRRLRGRAGRARSARWIRARCPR